MDLTKAERLPIYVTQRAIAVYLSQHVQRTLAKQRFAWTEVTRGSEELVSPVTIQAPGTERESDRARAYALEDCSRESRCMQASR
jgi:hypothetical protein